MSNNLTVIEGICHTLDSMGSKIKEVLPHGMDVHRFIATAKNGIQTHPNIDKLALADRRTLFAACQKAAADGLTLDGREAALSVFGNKVTYMPMVQGIVKLARNSGQIANLISEVVYSNDNFTFRLGIDDVPAHEPNWFGDRGDPVGAWCAIKLNSGEYIVRVLAKDKILKIASKTRTPEQYDPKNGLYFDEFWRKTAIKNALKYAPKSTYLESAINNDNDAQGFNFNEGEAVEQTNHTKPSEPRAATIIKKTTKQEGAVDAQFDPVVTEPPFDVASDSTGDTI